MKFVTYNSQQKLYPQSELYNIDLSGLDFVFLQRCHVLLAEELAKKFNFNRFWTAAVSTTDKIGLCVLTKKDIEFYSHRVDVEVTKNDNNQSDVYQKVLFEDLVFINFLPPFLPRESKIPYLKSVLTNNFDLALGDTHHNLNAYTVRSLLNPPMTVVNTKDNFMSEGAPDAISWVVLNADKLVFSNENVVIDTTKKMCHFPVFFDIERTK